MTSITIGNGTTGTINYSDYIAIDNDELLKKAEKKVIAINRQRKIDAILEDKEYIPFLIEETEEYKLYNDLNSHYSYENMYKSIAYGEYICDIAYGEYICETI